MRIELAYGKTGKSIDLPEDWNVKVVRPRHLAGLADAHAALLAGLRHPTGLPALADLAGDGQIGIILNDITRATPNPQLLRAILHELGAIDARRITLFIALGSHRECTQEELRELTGEDAYGRFRIVQNQPFDPDSQLCIGRTSRGTQVWLNRELADCRLRILTGFIEPHFFAGFSGGGKALMPGMAGERTILQNHRYEHIADPRATWGVTRGNPIWEDVREIAHLLSNRCGGQNFLFNITLNRDKQITGVFAGDLDLAHQAGVAFARRTAMQPVSEPYDIVLTTNSGYPLDLNLYQTIKGISAAARITRAGGAIVAAAECWDGIPSHGLYGQLLSEAGSPERLLERLRQPGHLKQDQWQAQIQAQIQLQADVYIHSAHLSAAQIRSALLLPAPSLEGTLRELVGRYGPDARICVLPEGPLTIAYVAR